MLNIGFLHVTTVFYMFGLSHYANPTLEELLKPSSLLSGVQRYVEIYTSSNFQQSLPKKKETKTFMNRGPNCIHHG